MATLQKFKLLATQCGVAPSPTRSPRTSPLVQLRRRKTTLRMLLSRSSSRCRSPPRRQEFSNQATRIVVGDLAEKKSNKEELPGRTLKDLFVSTPSLESEAENTATSKIGFNSEGAFAAKISGGSFGGLRDEPGSPRPVWVGFRHRMLLRRAWRPMLVAIPE
ncbi:hypothetical protein HS088_TW02G00920 [Tripterygium wilfordii]|uniref:Uncharacterized protein n=1 Tax=Tripterygium wilfordii TaxID=458696 RepID=A0A7J7E045_TRIWF|nr:uncharacterized protein LOC119979987 [Tripterygium wilfordii]KAF5751901.1 hypothetical protein HS088_TW02G00920 [Tripterygium wilfordii]